MNLLQILKQLKTLRWKADDDKGEPQVVTAEVHGKEPTEEEPKGE